MNLCGVDKPCPLLREETVPAVRAWSTSCLCTSLVPRSKIVLFGLGTSLHARMRTKLENGVLRNGQQLHAVCCEWHDLGKLQVLKTLCIAGPAR